MENEIEFGSAREVLDIDAAVVLINRDECTVWDLNEEAELMLRASRESLLGRSCKGLLCSPTQDCRYQCCSEMPSREHLTRMDGTKVFVRRVSTPLVMGEGRYLLNSFVPIESGQDTKPDLKAELERCKTRLIQSEKLAAVGQLAAGVAHEINNPIGFVKSNIGTLSEYTNVFLKLIDLYNQLRNATPDKHAAVCAQIDEVWGGEDYEFISEDVLTLLGESEEGLVRVQEIVQNLKTFAHADAGKVVAVDLNECLDATIKIVWNEIKYNCKLIRDYGVLPAFTCKAGQLNQVFMNLLVNASHAIEGMGDITVETSAKEGHIQIRISDTGCGMDDDTLARIFEPFFTTKGLGKGTGLGLAISKEIVEDYGGTMSVESVIGEGTCFTIELPLEK